MALYHVSKSESSLIRSLFILGLVLYLAKGQLSVSASSDCSGDPVQAPIELVLSNAPDYNVHVQSKVTQGTVDGTAIAESFANRYVNNIFLSEQYNNHTRLVLKSGDYSFFNQPRIISFCRNQHAYPRSSNADPLLMQ